MTLDSSPNVNTPNANISNAEQAKMSFQLASVWLRRGQIERAIAGYQKVLQLQPDHLQAAIHLNHLQQQQQWSQLHDPTIQGNPGKINLPHQKTFAAHRCGWSFAIHALKSLHNSQGVLCDGYLENSFVWEERKMSQGKVPYKQPWLGFLHNPPAMPTWFFSRDAPQFLFGRDSWQQSLEHCVGLFSLSEYHAEWIREQTGKPVSALIHPTEIPDLQFDFDRFAANPDKKIIQLGWWLRKLTGINQLPIAKENPLGYQKIRLNPEFAVNAKEQLNKLIETEIKYEQVTIEPAFAENTQTLRHVPNQDYDRLLSENIGFAALYDASANNAVIECIARATPLLVNPLPAIVEYLGEDYPMYFSHLSEAAEKAMDLGRVRATHQYLKACPTRQKLSADYFLKSFQASEVYQRIEL